MRVEAQTNVTTSGGTTNSIPVFSGSFTLGNSVLSQYSGRIGLGTTTPIQPVTIINGGYASIYGGQDATSANAVVTLSKNPFLEIVGNNYGNVPPAVGLVQTSICNPASYQDPAELFLGAPRAASASTVGMGPVGNTDMLGRIGFFGDDGTNLRTKAAAIDVEVYTINTPVSTSTISAALNLATSSNAPIIFYTNAGSSWNPLVGTSNEKMRVAHNGNVGISTTSPGAKLEVNGNLKLTAGSGAFITFPDGTTQSTAFTGSGVSGISQSNGNIGIGTTSPVAPLDVNGFLSGAGNLGIGTTSPSAKVEVNGNVKLTSGSGASITFADGTVQITAYTGVTCGGDYTESVDVSGERKNYEPGDVLVLTSDGQGTSLNLKSPIPRWLQVFIQPSSVSSADGRPPIRRRQRPRFPWR